MRRFHLFAAALLASAVPGMASAQGSNAGREFVEAVRKSDGNKMLELAAANPKGIVDSRGWDGDTPLVIAIARRDTDYTAYLLNAGADPNLPGNKGEYPIIAAGRAGFAEAVGWLIGLGAKVDSTNRSGETALILAVQGHHGDTVKALLAAGADPDKQDSVAGYSARDYARRDPRARDLLKLIEARKPAAAAK